MLGDCRYSCQELVSLMVYVQRQCIAFYDNERNLLKHSQKYIDSMVSFVERSLEWPTGVSHVRNLCAVIAKDIEWNETVEAAFEELKRRICRKWASSFSVAATKLTDDRSGSKTTRSALSSRINSIALLVEKSQAVKEMKDKKKQEKAKKAVDTSVGAD